LTTHALNTPTPAAAPETGLTVLRYLDLIVLALALPVFLAFSLPLLGYAAAAAAWLIQRAIQHFANTKAEASDDPRTSVGVLAGSMLGRGWLTAGTILAVGLLGTRPDGLAAAVLAISLFTIYFATQMVVRPIDEARRRPLPPREPR
jgi:Sec-independent protein secretion pathway component TatC